ncbi:hypothetical protein C8R45DRAFT_942398 [Mycena sanguinolenta]|nr:hypothetical protein C8R45DRAFT_942398 [Mycena sanguinolenta]
MSAMMTQLSKVCGRLEPMEGEREELEARKAQGSRVQHLHEGTTQRKGKGRVLEPLNTPEHEYDVSGDEECDFGGSTLDSRVEGGITPVGDEACEDRLDLTPVEELRE